MGIVYVGTFLAEHGYSVEVYDPNLTRTSASTVSKYGGIDWDNIKDYLQSRTFTYVGLDCTNTSNVLKTYKLAQLVKAIDPRLFVFVGGVHATAVPEQTLQECEDIDAVVLGDGEETTLEMLDVLSGGEELANVPGLCVRTKGEPIRSQRRRHSRNLDPYTIDRDLVHLNKYRRMWSDHNVSFHGFTDPAGFIITARRCPAHCTYCAQSSNFRLKSMDAVRSEILEIIEKYNCRRFYIMDGTFNISRKRVLEFCESVVDLSIEWFCFLRVVGLDSSLVERMRDAGFVGASIGLESGIQAVVDYYDKRVSVGEYRQAIHLLQSSGAYVHGSFIIGAPIETKEMMLSSVAFAKTLGLDGLCFNLLSVYPGTALWDRLKDEGRLVTGVPWENYYHGIKGRPTEIFQHPLYSARDLNIIAHYCDYESRFLQKGTVYSTRGGGDVLNKVRSIRNIVLRWYYRHRVRLIREKVEPEKRDV